MYTYIVLFRGINVGGKNILPMKMLIELLEALEFKNIKTYIQSGNVVFQSNETGKDALVEQISLKILENFNFSPKIMLLEQSEIAEIVQANPFNTENGKALHFYFLKSVPHRPDMQKLETLKSASEDFKLTKKVFYLYAPDGIGRSKLAAQVETCMRVPTTARNWNTVSKLLHIAESM